MSRWSLGIDVLKTATRAILNYCLFKKLLATFSVPKKIMLTFLFAAEVRGLQNQLEVGNYRFINLKFDIRINLCNHNINAQLIFFCRFL